MTPYFFAYGTLMSRTRGPHALRLAREAASLGPATVRGQLYDLGGFPGLVPGDAPGALVHGELFALRRPAHTLAWLDAYEGAAYRRLRRPVFREKDETEAVVAWVYAYRRSVSVCRPIASGRWLGV